MTLMKNVARCSLTLIHTHSPQFAILATLLSLISSSPASLLHGCYSEPFYTAFALRGLILCAKRQWFLASLAFGLATAFRANGVLLAGYLIWGLVIHPLILTRMVRRIRSPRGSRLDSHLWCYTALSTSYRLRWPSEPSINRPFYISPVHRLSVILSSDALASLVYRSPPNDISLRPSTLLECRIPSVLEAESNTQLSPRGASYDCSRMVVLGGRTERSSPRFYSFPRRAFSERAP